MLSFLVTHQGSQKGPFTSQEILSLIQKNELGWKDHLFDEVSQSWVYIMEYPLFTQDFNSSFDQPLQMSFIQNHRPDTDLKKRHWFVLKEATNYGPFSKLEILQMLQGKTLFEYDFLWSDSFDSWKKVSELEEFSVEYVRKIHNMSQLPFERDLNQVFFRRKYVRMKADNRIIIHDQKKIYNTLACEISEGGASFKLENYIFNLEQKLYLHFVAGQGIPQFNAIAKVVSQRGSLIGVQFVNIPGVAQNFISKLSETVKKAA